MTASDDELIAAARSGDRRALDTLLRRHHARIHALCRRLTANEADADDATQQALIAIVRGLAGFDGRARFTTWAYRVATNACLDELRRRGRRPLVGLPDDGADRPGVLASSPDRDPADTVSTRLELDEALASLPEEFRAAVVLRDVAGLDYAEIGEVLGIPPGTVRSRIARGRGRLADLLGGTDDTPPPAGNPGTPARRPTDDP